MLQGMPRPPRLDYADALHHVTSRGVRGEAIFRDELDRQRFMALVCEVMVKFGARLLAYCLMGNHYHFVVRTPGANMSEVMRDINGRYARWFNRRHGLVGHLFQARYEGVHVDRDAYLLEVCRYVDLNPVRAGLVDRALQWAWSGHRAVVGLADPPPCFARDEILGMLLGHDIRNAIDRRVAIARYQALVASARSSSGWRRAVRHGRYLGADEFVHRLAALADRRKARLEQPGDPPVAGHVYARGGRHLGQARHGHDVAAHDHDELRTRGQPDFTDVQHMSGRRAEQFRIRRE